MSELYSVLTIQSSEKHFVHILTKTHATMNLNCATIKKSTVKRTYDFDLREHVLYIHSPEIFLKK